MQEIRASFKIKYFNKDYHPGGDYRFPKENNQALIVSYAFKILAGF